MSFLLRAPILPYGPGTLPQRSSSRNRRHRGVFLTFAETALAIALGFVVVVGGSGAFAPPAYAATNSLTISSSTTTGVDTSVAGQFTATASPAVLNVNDLVTAMSTGPVTVIASGSITVSNDVASATSNALTLQADGDIIVSPGVTVSTSDGAITFRSDADASGSGSILIGDVPGSRASLQTNGGNITLSGGSDVTTGYAMASAIKAGSKPIAGVGIFGSTLDADGGDILIRAKSTLTSGSTRALLVEKSADGSANYSRLTTSGTGTITVIGVGSDSSNSGIENPWGMVLDGAEFQTVSGDITVDGEALTSAVTENRRGWVIANTSFASNSGDIVLLDRTARINDFEGSYLTGATSFSTSGVVTISTDELDVDATLALDASSVTIESFRSTNFTETMNIQGTVNASGVDALVIGRSGNTGSINLSTAFSVGGPVTIHASTIGINKALTATGSTIYLHASTAVTQLEQITADKLALFGAGTFTLQNALNNVRILAGGSAASPLGSIKYTDASGGLTIGEVNPNGISSSGDIEIATLSGNLSVTEPVVSTKSSGDSVKLFADKDETAGNVGDGDVIVSGAGAVTVESDARALIYSGARSTNPGLVSLVGGASRTWTLVDATTDLSGLSPSVPSTGRFALFRVDIGPADPSDDSSGEASTNRSSRASASGSAELGAAAPALAATGPSAELTVGLPILAGILLLGGLAMVSRRRRAVLSHR